VTVLGPKGAPTPTVAARLLAPVSTMDTGGRRRRRRLAASLDLRDRYAVEIDRESAFELLAKRAEERSEQARPPSRTEEERADLASNARRPPRPSRARGGDAAFEAWPSRRPARSVARSAGTLIRGMLGTLREALTT
jgi:uncharacterized protein